MGIGLKLTATGHKLSKLQRNGGKVQMGLRKYSLRQEAGSLRPNLNKILSNLHHPINHIIHGDPFSLRLIVADYPVAKDGFGDGFDVFYIGRVFIV